ncbi:MAG: M23 family metallopeptidase, partial [Ilumatobacteraceae bacterium]
MMMDRPIAPTSPRRRTGPARLVAALLCLCTAWGVHAVTTVGAAPNQRATIAPADLGTADDSAMADADAVRGQVVAPPNFPMEPIPRCQILDNFGDQRSGGRTHKGADLLATLGQDVYAMVDGTLTGQTLANSGGSSGLSGNLWTLTATTGGTYYVYAHLSAFAPGLVKGSTVKAGQLIGWVGDTGNPGPGNYHLHFEIHPGGGDAVNPLPLLT